MFQTRCRLKVNPILFNVISFISACYHQQLIAMSSFIHSWNNLFHSFTLHAYLQGTCTGACKSPCKLLYTCTSTILHNKQKIYMTNVDVCLYRHINNHLLIIYHCNSCRNCMHFSYLNLCIVCVCNGTCFKLVCLIFDLMNYGSAGLSIDLRIDGTF